MNAAWAMDDVYGENWLLDGDLVVPEQVVFNPDSVHVRNSAEIENHGVFDSRIYLCNGCDLFVENDVLFVRNDMECICWKNGFSKCWIVERQS